MDASALQKSPRIQPQWLDDLVALGARPGAYSAEFIGCVEQLLKDEGGYVNNPADPGGETRWGISQRSYPDLDIKSLTRDGAIAIYWRDWWAAPGFDRLPPAIAAKLFNLSVNMGLDHAVKCLQRALRCCGHRVNEDGVLGELTIDSAGTCEMGVKVLMAGMPTPLMAALRCEAAGYYRTIAALERGRRKNGDGEFLNGWLNRAYE